MKGIFREVTKANGMKSKSSLRTAFAVGVGLAMVAGLAACGPQNQNAGFVSAGADSAGIIGGTDATGDEEFAKTVAALYNTSRGSLCTASILSDTVLLTAAHCVDGANATDLVAIFNKDLRGDDLVARRVTKAITSDLWEKNQNNETDTGDIAIVRIAGGLPQGFRPARILTGEEALNDGGDVMLAGYGISDGVKHSGAQILRFVTTQIKNKSYSKTEVLLDQTRGKGACHGDSGGPAYVRLNGELRLFGVTSRGIDDENNDCSKFSAYTNVLAYREWLEESIKSIGEAAPQPTRPSNPERAVALGDSRAF